MEGEPVSVNDGRILDFDPAMNLVERYYEDNDGQWTVERVQDVEDIIELNKAEYNSVDERATHKSESFNRYARLPLVVLMDLERKGILRDSKAFMKWLDDPDNRFFRTRPGRLS
jgi:hypothetical protein